MRSAQPIFAVLLLALAPPAAPAQCYGGVCPAPSYGRPAAPPSAQTTRLPRELLSAVARIIHHEPGGQSLGTGTLIADDRESSHILTCAHLFTEAGRTEVRLGGQQLPVRVIALDRQHDLALLRGPPTGVTPVEAAASQPSGRLTAGGFGPRGVARFIRGPVIGLATAVGASAPSLRIRGAVRSGDSGGPVFDASGRVIAVVWGARSGETFAMGGAPLRRILSKISRAAPPKQLTPIQRNKPTPEVTPSDLRALEERLASRLDQIAKQKPKPLPQDLVRQQDLHRLEQRLNQKQQIPLGEPKPVGEPPTQVGGAPHQTAWPRPDTLLTALAVGGPLGVALWAGKSWLRRRASQRLAAAIRPVAVDTPPPPQRVVPETHYVPYEKDDYARAHQWAREQIARKYPGSIEVLTGLESLIDQQLNGKPTA